jgi:hypothetical protein
VIKVDGVLVVDLGFACYFDLTGEQAKAVKEAWEFGDWNPELVK